MRAPLVRLYDDEGCIDGFAGGGGTSTGIEWALGRPPDVAINHDHEALAMHKANHPTTRHIPSNIRTVNYRRVLPKGTRCGFAWFSPDCTFHSKARGGKPFRDRDRARRIRGLAWEAVRCAEAIKPRVIYVENVEEFREWGPIGKDGRPDPRKRGKSFARWVSRLQNLGYMVEWRELRACDVGAPTSRKRLFVIARRDGLPIRWPKQTHGKLAPKPYRTAAECIDFDIPVPSIFLSQEESHEWARAHGLSKSQAPRRPLAGPTLRRIARGVMRYVVNAADPFIIPVNHGGDARVHSLHEPVRTITCSERGEFALVVPSLINTRNGERHGRHGEQAPRVLDIQAPFNTITAQGSQGALVAACLTKYHGERYEGDQRALSLGEPIRTLDTSNRFGLVAAFLAKHNGNGTGHDATGQRLVGPVDTITSRDSKALVTSHLVKLYGTCQDGQELGRPMPTVTAHGNHVGLVSAFLLKYFGTKADGCKLTLPLDTLTTKDRYGLVIVTIAGEDYAIVDIGMRMLTPRELYRAQGFPNDYNITEGIDVVTGEAVPFTKKAQTRLVGNSVPPHLAAALIAANLSDVPYGLGEWVA